MIKDGANDLEIADEMPGVYMKHFRGIEKVRSLVTKPRNPDDGVEIQIYWGESGTGKTRKAVDENPDAYILTKPNGNNILWWCEYQGQKTVIIDEFYGWIQYDFLLRLLDRYPLRVQTKGGSVVLAANKFIITSNKPWKEWYPNIDNTAALERRINEFGTITHFAALAERDAT